MRDGDNGSESVWRIQEAEWPLKTEKLVKYNIDGNKAQMWESS